MFLFPWLDWGIDISDFEKIDFLAHDPYLAFLDDFFFYFENQDEKGGIFQILRFSDVETVLLQTKTFQGQLEVADLIFNTFRTI